MMRKLAGMLLLTASLAACVDVDIDIALTSPETARATMTQVMNADFYTLTKLNAEDEQALPEFCTEGELTENIDGTATCILVEEGTFAELDLGQENGGITFTEEEPGLIRIALGTTELMEQAAINQELDADSADLVAAFFTGRNITITFSGLEVVETNMTLAEDEKRASQTVPLLDLINATAELPDELFAVVRAL